MNIQVLFEDNHLIAVNKPAGYLVQGDQTGDRPLSEYVKDYIKVRYNKPGDVFLGTIHRLDRPVSGVTIFARTSKGLTRMNELLKSRAIEKTYWAITQNRPDPLEGKLNHWIGKDRTKNISKAFAKQSNQANSLNAKPSELDYRLIGELDARFFLEVKPKTGRPHQIRVQLASIGCPIEGDLKYGAEKPNRDGSINLHCRAMSFIHPVKKEPVVIKADPPVTQSWNIFADLLGFD